MQIESFYHLPQNQYCYVENNNLIIRVRSKKNDAKKVFIRIGDPYSWNHGGGGGNLANEGAVGWICETFEMEKECSTKYFDYFKIAVKPVNSRSRYAFVFENENESFLYSENNILKIESIIVDDPGTYFCFPFFYESEAFKPPIWVENTIWYHIFVERFYNGKKSISPSNVVSWGSDPKHDNYMGGDLYGVYEKLDYIHDLGVNGIYLSPIFEAGTNHKYDTLDYYKIDPHFGDLEIMKKIVEKAHSLNMKVMIDIVFNHISSESFMWQDVIKNEEKSKYYNWFRIRKFPLIENNVLNYDAFAFVEHMPKLNFENQETFDYFINVSKYWLNELDIDGYRLDVANEIPHKFWKKFNEELTKIKHDFYILGEIWHDSTPWISNDEFHGVMNYPLGDALIKYFATKEISKNEFFEKFFEASIAYPDTINKAQYNLLGSHDTMRIISRGDELSLKQAMIFMFMQPGCPSIFYGDEVGLDGNSDLESRKCMPWGDFNLELLEFYKQIIALRKKENNCKISEIKFLDTDYLSFQKNDLLVILNEKPMNFDVTNYDVLLGNKDGILKDFDYLILKEKTI